MALVELGQYYNSLEAGLVRGFLAANGIEAYMFGFDNALEGIGFVIPVRLMVDESDRVAALALLSAADRGAAG